MAQPVFIAVNQTGSPITLRQLALTVPASGQVTLSDYNTPAEIQSDPELWTQVNAGNIRINDGTTTLSQAQSLQYLTVVAQPEAPATTAANVGAGSGVYAGKAGTELQFKSLTAGTNITLTPSGTELQVSASSGTNAPLSNQNPVNVSRSAASPGASGEVSRYDHKHDIATAAAVAVGTANAEGTSTSLARADHTHQVTGLAITSQAQGDVLYFNGSAWVRLPAGTAGQRLQTNGAGANPSWVDAGTTAIAEQTGTITTTSTTDVLATGMSITPGAGTYLVWFTGSVSHGTNNGSVFPSIYAAGAQVPASERQYNRANSSMTTPFACAARVTVAAGQAIAGYWRGSSGTSTMYQRTLMLLKVA